MLTDAEVIATWMEPKPPLSVAELVEARASDPTVPYPQWWTPGNHWEWTPRELTLDRLHLVEGRLGDDLGSWREYLELLLRPVAHSSNAWIHFGAMAHADAPTKISAIATILRPEVENAA